MVGSIKKRLPQGLHYIFTFWGSNNSAQCLAFFLVRHLMQKAQKNQLRDKFPQTMRHKL
jgi:hypothetical protein